MASKTFFVNNAIAFGSKGRLVIGTDTVDVTGQVALLTKSTDGTHARTVNHVY